MRIAMISFTAKVARGTQVATESLTTIDILFA